MEDENLRLLELEKLIKDLGYCPEELRKDNPFSQWMFEDEDND
jgi:hypothetical protein